MKPVNIAELPPLDIMHISDHHEDPDWTRVLLGYPGSERKTWMILILTPIESGIRIHKGSVVKLINKCEGVVYSKQFSDQGDWQTDSFRVWVVPDSTNFYYTINMDEIAGAAVPLEQIMRPKAKEGPAKTVYLRMSPEHEPAPLTELTDGSIVFEYALRRYRYCYDPSVSWEASNLFSAMQY